MLGMIWLIGFGLFVSPKDQIQRGQRAASCTSTSRRCTSRTSRSSSPLCASAAYLWKRTRSLTWDRIAGASAEIGVFFMAITLVTGSVWGSISWGTYWVWDARLTTTAFLFVTYIGYLAVRRLGGSPRVAARRSAIMALIAVLEVPLVHSRVEWWRPLHQSQDASPRREIDGLMLFSLFVGIITFTLFYVWLLLHRQRVLYIEDAMDDHGLELALAERRTEGRDRSRCSTPARSSAVTPSRSPGSSATPLYTVRGADNSPTSCRTRTARGPESHATPVTPTRRRRRKRRSGARSWCSSSSSSVVGWSSSKFLTSAIDYYCNADEIGVKRSAAATAGSGSRARVDQGSIVESADGGIEEFTISLQRRDDARSTTPNGAGPARPVPALHPGRRRRSPARRALVEGTNVEVKHSEEYEADNPDRIDRGRSAAACSQPA